MHFCGLSASCKATSFYSACMCTCACRVGGARLHTPVRGQHGGVISFLLPCGSQESTWVGGPGSRGLFTRRHLSSDNCHSCQKAMLTGVQWPKASCLLSLHCELPQPYVLSSFDTGLLLTDDHHQSKYSCELPPPTSMTVKASQSHLTSYSHTREQFKANSRHQ